MGQLIGMFGRAMPRNARICFLVLFSLAGRTVMAGRQERHSRDAVQKIETIENTLDEIEDIIVGKEDIINGLSGEINQLKDEVKIRKERLNITLEELRVCQDDNEMFTVFQNYESSNMRGEIEKRQQMINSQANEIHRLEGKILDLESVRTSSNLNRQEEAHDWKECEFQRNQLLGLRQEYDQYKNEVFQNFTNVGNQNFVFERAVLSLKQVIRDNNLKIIDLKGEIDYNYNTINEKDMKIEMQNEEVQEYEANRKKLQRSLDNSEKAIIERDLMLRNLSEELESFKSYKDILSGVIDQLKTINSPDFDFGHFMDRVKRKTENDDNANNLGTQNDIDIKHDTRQDRQIQTEETMETNMAEDIKQPSDSQFAASNYEQQMVAKQSQSIYEENDKEMSVQISPYLSYQPKKQERRLQDQTFQQADSQRQTFIYENSLPSIPLSDESSLYPISSQPITSDTENSAVLHIPQVLVKLPDTAANPSIEASSVSKMNTTTSLPFRELQSTPLIPVTTLPIVSSVAPRAPSQPNTNANSSNPIPVVSPTPLTQTAIPGPSYPPNMNTAIPRKSWTLNTARPENLLLVTPFVWKQKQQNQPRKNYKYTKRKIGKKVSRPRKRIREKPSVDQ